jgi:ankyrin repeat protein
VASDNYLRNIIDWNAKDNDGWTFLHRASSEGHLNIIQFVGSNEYLRDKIDWNAKDNYGWTFLHEASSRGFLEIIQFFFENPENFELVKDIIYAKTNNGETLLSIVHPLNVKIINYLLSKGYNPFIGNVKDLEEYKEEYKQIVEEISSKEDLEEAIKENNFNKEVFELGLIIYFSENCNENLMNFIK